MRYGSFVSAIARNVSQVMNRGLTRTSSHRMLMRYRTVDNRWWAAEVGPECVKTPGHRELTRPMPAQVAACEGLEHKRQTPVEHIAKAQQPGTGVTPASPS